MVFATTSSRFRIGKSKDLINRVELAKKRGAVAYVPSGRAGLAEAEEDAEDIGDEDAA